uniref:Uncharacterized protein n=1 Tax=Anguilla anguilla TaxID=7936 RepID=A0A0E9RJR2_ANGAN
MAVVHSCGHFTLSAINIQFPDELALRPVVCGTVCFLFFLLSLSRGFLNPQTDAAEETTPTQSPFSDFGLRESPFRAVRKYKYHSKKIKR